MLQIFYAEKQLCFKAEVKHIIHIITIKTQKQLVRGTSSAINQSSFITGMTERTPANTQQANTQQFIN